MSCSEVEDIYTHKHVGNFFKSIHNAAWTAAKAVLRTEMKHLLCRRHVDSFAQHKVNVDANTKVTFPLLYIIVDRNQWRFQDFAEEGAQRSV